MSEYGIYAVHPFADRFPLIEGEGFAALVKSIQENGLRESIVLAPDGTTIVDGRNRYRACHEARVDAHYRTLGAHYDEKLIRDFIIDHNITRRHLTPGQRAMLALEIEKFFAEEAKKRQVEAGKEHGRGKEKVPADPPEAIERHQNESREQAARVTGASGKGVQMAKKIATVAPDIAKEVTSGKVSLDAAYKQAQRIEKEQEKKNPEKEAPPASTARTILLKTHDGAEVAYKAPKGGSKFNATPGDGISWASWSWNPVTGCLRNCPYCYAREIAAQERMKAVYPAGFTPLFHHERLDAPKNTPLPKNAADNPAARRVFVCSMSDLYGNWVPDDWIESVHEACAANPQWQYIHLTKNPARYVIHTPPHGGWIGASVDEQKMVRIAEDAMSRVEGAAVRWLSIEPMREELRFNDLSMFDWVVIGAQTETRQPTGVVPAFAPPFEWVARIVTQAREAGCRIHLKPNLLGATTPQSPGMTLPDEYPEPVTSPAKAKKTGGQGDADA